MTELSLADATQMFRGKPDRFLDVGAGEAAYRCIGSGPDVLFVHGWPVSGATWRLLLPHLVEHVTCHIIDLPTTGSSRYDATTPVSVAQHITSVKRIVDLLGVEHLAVVGHDSGGLIARHALVGDRRVRAMGLINTEPVDPSWRFKSFIMSRRLPGIDAALKRIAGSPRVRRLGLVFGDAFADRTRLDGDFADFFFTPLHDDAVYRAAAVKLLKSFDMRFVTDLGAIHGRIDVPVKLVWGDKDPFFPVYRAKAMVDEFPQASLDIIAGAGLFSHEEAPAEVAAALLPTLTA